MQGFPPLGRGVRYWLAQCRGRMCHRDYIAFRRERAKRGPFVLRPTSWGLCSLILPHVRTSVSQWLLARGGAVHGCAAGDSSRPRGDAFGSRITTHYATFRNNLPSAVDHWRALSAQEQYRPRVSSWGNHLSLRVHLLWRWGELVSLIATKIA